MEVCAYLGPLPWVLGVPVGGGVFRGGEAFASFALGCRPATVIDSAEMVLLSSVSSAFS